MFVWPVILVLGIFLFYYRVRLTKLQAQLNTLSEDSAKAVKAASKNAISKDIILDLLVLRLRLLQEAKAGQVADEVLDHLLGQIDKSLQSHDLKRHKITPNDHQWKERSRRAWHALERRGDIAIGPPPWEKEVVAAKPAATIAHEDSELVEFLPVHEEIATKPKKTAPRATRKTVPESARQHAWQAAKPSELEKALQRISGWPKILLPFFVQNIGWFIGGFCFLAGSIFLVSYTSGFLKSITVFFALFAYTLFLIWFGYRLQLKHSVAKTGGGVLMTMGMLLVPLNISAAVRLIVTSNTNLLHMSVGWLLAILAIGIYYYLAQLITGLIDRTLQGFYPVVFLLLTSFQLAVPLLSFWPEWQIMALFHILLLGLLSYGFYCYVNDWMRSIFVEQKKIAYFASGVLLYTACISFVHLTWGVDSLATPRGYYAPYLMVICGLLLYLESKFKEWVQRNVALSRLTFVIYGISIIALTVATQGVTLILTLSLAIVIYGVVVLRYYTLTPLYLVMASLAGLYFTVLLRHYAWDLYLLLSLPGLAALFIVSHYIRNLDDGRFAVYRLAIILYRVQTFSFFFLGLWSLIHSQPGPIGFATALVLTGGSWWILQFAPGPLLCALSAEQYNQQEKQAGVNLTNSPWLYITTVSMTISMAFTPAWYSIRWESRFAGGAMILACLWTWLAIRCRLRCENELTAKIEVLSNSGLLSVIIGLALVFPNPIEAGDGILFPVLCTVGAAVLLCLSLGFYVRWLFYGFLILIATAVGLVKLNYFPGTSVGSMKILLGLGLWFGLWWLECQPDEVDELRQERLQLDTPLHLLWFFPISSRNKADTPVSEIQKTEGGRADV